jgi:probable HAF family extracellular repeat protein
MKNNSSRRFPSAASLWVAASLLAACGGGGGGSGEAPVEQARFISLGTAPGYTESVADALSADGSVVAGTLAEPGGQHEAFRWSEQGGIVRLGFLPGGTKSNSSGISSDGSVIVGNGSISQEPLGSSSVAFRWSAAGGMQHVPNVEGANMCSAAGVSGDGLVVAGACLTAGNVAFRWTQQGGTIVFGRYGGGMSASSTARAISRDASVVVGAGNPFIAGAMLWRAPAEPVFIGKLKADDSNAWATAVSSDGRVVVGMSTDVNGVAWPFRWTEAGGITQLSTSAGGISGSVPMDTSGDASRVVGFSITSGGESAFLWDAQRGLRPLADALAADYGLTLSGWTLHRANAISDDGSVIAGQGLDPQGAVRGWVVRLPR